MSFYRVKRVNATQPEVVEVLARLHYTTLPGIQFPIPQAGYWWIAYRDAEPVAFAHLCPSTYYPNSGYFARVGVLEGHRGHGLQRRLMRLAEKVAWQEERWDAIVSDTTNRPFSEANFRRLKYREFTPEQPWDRPGTTYWWKGNPRT